jgi:hypothetical protein
MDTEKEEKTREAESVKCHCPYCRFMEKFSWKRRRNEEFWEHLDKAHIELLEAFRSALDSEIQRIKKRKDRTSEGLTKIEIE